MPYSAHTMEVFIFFVLLFGADVFCLVMLLIAGEHRKSRGQPRYSRNMAIGLVVTSFVMVFLGAGLGLEVRMVQALSYQ